MAEHLSLTQYISCFLGIFLFWVIAYGTDKEDFDNTGNRFNYISWFRYFFWDRHDDIIVHLTVSFVALFMGEANFKALAGRWLTELPEAGNEVGTAFMIGLAGSFIGVALKKVYRKIRTEVYITKYLNHASTNQSNQKKGKQNP